VQRGLVWVQRGLVDIALVRLPRPAPLPQKTSAGSPAQMICSAQEESPQRRKFNEDEYFKIMYCKSRKKEKEFREGHQIIFKSMFLRFPPFPPFPIFWSKMAAGLAARVMIQCGAPPADSQLMDGNGGQPVGLIYMQISSSGN
jgi:hypothetical protein